MNPDVRESFDRQAGWCERLGSPFTALACRALAARLSEGSAFGARLHNGVLNDITQIDVPAAREAQVKLRMTGADLIRLTNGELNFAQAWAKGQVKIDASVFDLLKLRSIF